MPGPPESTVKPATVDFGRFMPGTLRWVAPANGPAAEDRLVTSAFQFLVDGGLTPGTARELGRTLGRQAGEHSLGEYLDAFSHLGIGALKVATLLEDRYTFTGEGLRGSERANAPSCAAALGFLEGAVERATGGGALGTELQCRSRGHAACTFTVKARR